MKKVQEVLDSLQPYVIGIRYLNGTALVDVVFKEGWSVPEDKQIKVVKGDNEMNYYMIFSEVNGIGLDELLEYVSRVISLNKEREKKHDLLKEKVNELKEIFKKNPLNKLMKLRYSFVEDEVMPNLGDFDIDDETFLDDNQLNETTEPLKVPIEEKQINISEPIEYLDEHGSPINISEEEREIIEEEERAKRNIQKLNNKPKQFSDKPKVELPPKRKLAPVNEGDYYSECECSENEACEKCIDNK